VPFTLGVKMLTLQELLNFKTDLFKNSRVKLVRHLDTRKEYREVIKDREKLLYHQATPRNDIFKDCDYIISFIGDERCKAILFGVFKVYGREERENDFYYSLVEEKGFEGLIGRVVIDWGNNARAWHQWYNQTKEIIQILPAGYIGSFPGLLQFVLDSSELQKIISNSEANADWKHHLSAVNGIYLILDENTGSQYIGSASGKHGIWQRWSVYAKNWHGGNLELKKLFDKDAAYNKNLRYSVLQALPSNVTQDEIVKIENLYKQKLGSRAHGLNCN